MKRFAYRLLAAISLLAALANPAHVRDPSALWRNPARDDAIRAWHARHPRRPTVPADYWDAARTLSLIGDTLVRMDVRDRPQPALAVAWQSDSSNSHWQFTLRRGVKFHDGSAATPAAVAQILSAIHPELESARIGRFRVD